MHVRSHSHLSHMSTYVLMHQELSFHCHLLYHGTHLTLRRWSSYHCLLLRTQIDFSLASTKRSCAWALIDHFQRAVRSYKRKTLRKPEASKPGLSAETSSHKMPSAPARLPTDRGCFSFWLIHVGNGLGSTKNSKVSRYKTLDQMTFEHLSDLYEPMIQLLRYAHYKSEKMQHFTSNLNGA